MKKLEYTKQLLQNIIQDSKTFKEVTFRLGISYGNGSVKMLKEKIIEFELDISHFKCPSRGKKLKTEKIFILNSKTDRRTVRERILKENLLEYKCQCCGCNNQWMGRIMPLILDHINGVNNDNRLENLRFLCSNCDSIQDTYKGKNTSIDSQRKKIRKEIEKQNIRLQKQEKKQKQIDKNKQSISHIDFSKHGWRLEVAKILECTPQYAGKYIKEYMPEFWKICKRHLK